MRLHGSAELISESATRSSSCTPFENRIDPLLLLASIASIRLSHIAPSSFRIHLPFFQFHPGTLAWNDSKRVSNAALPLLKRST